MATSDEEQVFNSHSCQLCNAVDTMRMVQCDACNQWFHYDCVGVSDSVADRDWSYEQCIQLQEEVQDLEDCHGKPKKIDEFSYVSTKASTRKSMTSRQKAAALARLEEEQAIKMDILNRKYQILELTESEEDKVSGRSSMDYTLRWAKQVQHLTTRSSETLFHDNVSISLSDREREIINKRSVQDLKTNAYVLVESARRGFDNVLKPSVLMTKADGQQRQWSHLKATYGQSKSDAEPKAERGFQKIELADVEEFFRQYRSVDGKFVQVGNELKAKAVPKIQRQIILEDQQAHNPRKVFEPRERESEFVTGPAEEQRDRRWSMSGNMGSRSTPVHRSNTNEKFDWHNFNRQDSRQPLGNIQLPTAQPVIQSSDVNPSPLVLTDIGAKKNVLCSEDQGSGYVGRDPATPLTQTHIASRHVS